METVLATLKLRYHYISRAITFIIHLLCIAINKEFISKTPLNTNATGTSGMDQNESKQTTGLNVINLYIC